MMYNNIYPSIKSIFVKSLQDWMNALGSIHGSSFFLDFIDFLNIRNRNTKFFHLSTIIRRRRNFIAEIKLIQFFFFLSFLFVENKNKWLTFFSFSFFWYLTTVERLRKESNKMKIAVKY